MLISNKRVKIMNELVLEVISLLAGLIPFLIGVRIGIDEAMKWEKDAIERAMDIIFLFLIGLGVGTAITSSLAKIFGLI